MASVAQRHYMHRAVSIREARPPEELLALSSGGCGRWQIAVGVMAFICEYLHGLNIFITRITLPHKVSFTCADGPGSNPCLTVNETKCEKFIFHKTENLTTLTEQFSLVCDREHMLFWMEFSFAIGLSVSYLLVGFVADKFGKKIASMIFIPLNCLSGAVVATSDTYQMYMVFRFIHALFSSVLNLLPLITLCDNVGNQWRTFAIGIMLIPVMLSWLTAILVPYLFRSAKTVIAIVSLLPLPLLITLLYFRNSPIYILVYKDFIRAEEAFRKIAQFNRRPLPTNVKVRPVKLVIVDESDKPTLSLKVYFRTPRTKNLFLALTWLWLFNGICIGAFDVTIIYNMKRNTVEETIMAVASLVGGLITVALCYLFQPQKILCVLLLLKNTFLTATLFKMHEILNQQRADLLYTFKLLSFVAYWTSMTVLLNITPRLLPTGRRSQGTGFCFFLFHMGRVILLGVGAVVPKDVIVWVVIPLFVAVGPVTETFCSCFLWNVHNRELPDYVNDCVDFDSFFKPRRHVLITDQKATQNEIEVEDIFINSI